MRKRAPMPDTVKPNLLQSLFPPQRVSANDYVKEIMHFAGLALVGGIFIAVFHHTKSNLFKETWPWFAAWFAYVPLGFLRDWRARHVTLTPFQRERRNITWLRWGAILSTAFAGFKTAQTILEFVDLASQPDAPPFPNGVWYVLGAMAGLMLTVYWALSVNLWRKVALSEKSWASAEQEMIAATGDTIVVEPATSAASPVSKHWWTDNGVRSEINEVKVKRGE